jgi:hypothetical protein
MRVRSLLTSLAVSGLVTLAAVPAAAATLFGVITDPPDSATTPATFTVRGYTAETPVGGGSTGVDAVHIWAYPDDGSAAIFVGATTSFSFDGHCGQCGFTIPGSALSPGGYTLAGLAREVSTGQFAPFASIHITVPATPPTVMTVATTATSATAVAVSWHATAIAYDDKHDVFLQAWEDNGNVFGRFVGFDGATKGDRFLLATNRLSTAALPLVAYSRAAPDDVFLVLFQSDAMSANTAKNVFAQRLRFTGQGLTGGTLLGGPLEVSSASHDPGTTQVPDAVVFNPISRQFLLVWDEGNFRPVVQLRHIRPDGTLPAAAVTLPEDQSTGCWEIPTGIDVSAQSAAFDWQHGRYTVTYTRRFTGALHCPPWYVGKYAVLDAATLAPVVPARGGALCQTYYPCLSSSAVGYVADSDAFVINWASAPHTGWIIRTEAALIAADGSLRNGPVVLGVGAYHFGAGGAYDPDAGRGVSVAQRSTTTASGGTAAPTEAVAVLAGPDGIPLTTGLSLSAPATVTSSPAIVAARDGTFGVSYTTTTGAVLQRLQVPIAQPGLHFSNVVAHLDGPARNVRPGAPFNVLGWAIDFGASTGTAIDAVHVWAYPAGGGSPVFLGATEVFEDRRDAADEFGLRFARSGFQIPASGLPAGTYTIVAYPHSALTGQFSSATASTITIAAPVAQPIISIDTPAANMTLAPGFDVGGWAIDLGAESGGGIDVVHVYAFAANGAATFLGVAPVNRPRGDVGAAYGPQFGSAGFRLTSPALAPGPYRIVVYAHSTVTGSFVDSRFTDITVRPAGDPLMAIDAPSNGATIGQPFVLGGWAIDRDAATGPGVDAVHVWAYPLSGGSPIFAGTGQLDFERGDIGTIFGAQFTNSGYNVTVSGLPPGQYQIAVYAHSTVTGTFNQSRVVTVTVQ